MAQHEVVIVINQQQAELIDKTIARGHAADRAALIRRALHEFTATHPPAQRRPETK
jgi:Arc/MetJ-type ribon-helix-helix transcriptional regulator